MMTRKLWYALHHPPARHPLFLRTVLLPAPARRPFVSWATLLIDLVLGVAFNTPTLLFLLMPFFLLIIGVSYGLDCALRVSTTIAKEHEDRTFDLLSLAPTGQWGTNWALATSSLYRNRDFDRLFTIIRAALATALVLTCIVALIAAMSLTPSRPTRLPQPSTTDMLMRVAADFLAVLALLAAIYVEYVQSTVLGSVVGLIVPTYAHNRLDASLWSFSVFLLLQVSTYALAWLIGFNLLPDAYERLQINGWYANFSLPVLRVAVFFLLREAIITALWRALVQRLNLHVGEVDLTLQFSA
jgi:hypothetical protein